MAEPLVSFDRVAEIYDATRGFPAGVDAAVGRGLAALLPGPGARVVEVGVGTGRVAVPLAKEGIRVVGLDLSARMLARLRAKGAGVEAIRAEASRPPLRDGCCDAVLFVHVLHLVPNVEATVAAALRLLGPGGLLLSCTTDESEGPVAEAAQAIARATAEVTGRSARPARARAGEEVVRRLAEDAGALLRGAEVARWVERVSGQQLLDELAGRVHSRMWVISDAELPAVIARARPEVERICGGLDLLHEQEAVFRVLVAELPTS